MLKQSSFVKVPSDICVYADLKNKYLLLKNTNTKKLIKLNSKVIPIKNKKKVDYLYISTCFLFKNKKKVNEQQKSISLFLKKVLKEMVFKNSKKLNLNGVGYKILIMENSLNNCILHFKLGYSHSVYLKLPKDIIVKLNKNNTLFLSGPSIKKLTLISSLIKKCKSPDVYKGKGFLYEYERLALKIGKKS